MCSARSFVGSFRKFHLVRIAGKIQARIVECPRVGDDHVRPFLEELPAYVDGRRFPRSRSYSL